MKTYCKNCVWYKRQKTFEYRINIKFVYPNSEEPYMDMIGGWVCYHPACFKYTQEESIDDGINIVKTRIRGQAQLNKNYNCKYFKPTKLFKIKKFFNRKD